MIVNGTNKSGNHAAACLHDKGSNRLLADIAAAPEPSNYYGITEQERDTLDSLERLGDRAGRDIYIDLMMKCRYVRGQRDGMKQARECERESSKIMDRVFGTIRKDIAAAEQVVDPRDAAPLTSIGPSGIGGEYQTEVRP